MDFQTSDLDLGSNRSHMGRSILVMLLVTILAISRVSNNPTPSACHHLCSMPSVLPSRCEQGGGAGGALSRSTAAS